MTTSMSHHNLDDYLERPPQLKVCKQEVHDTKLNIVVTSTDMMKLKAMIKSERTHSYEPKGCHHSRIRGLFGVGQYNT